MKSELTKTNIRRDTLDVAKAAAKKHGQSITKYIDGLILSDQKKYLCHMWNGRMCRANCPIHEGGRVMPSERSAQKGA